MRISTLCAALLLLSLPAFAVEPVAKVPVTQDTAALYVADRAWSAALKQHDLEATVALFTDDATIIPPQSAMVTGTKEVRAFYARAFADKAFAVNREPTQVEVAGDMAYTIGTYRKEGTGEGGKTATEDGKYVLVWKRQPDATWKIAVDVWNH